MTGSAAEDAPDGLFNEEVSNSMVSEKSLGGAAPADPVEYFEEQEVLAEPEPALEVATEPEPDELDSVSESVYEDVVHEEPASLDEHSNATGPEALDEIAEFGNSPISQGNEGQYVYTLNLSGIDSGEIRKSLVDALSDDKFKWNVNEIISNIEKGELSIQGLNPAKAFVIVNRIKFLPIDIDWIQHDITN